MRVVINGRFLAQVHTGVQRYALQTLLALDDLLDDPARPSALEIELLVPPGAKTVDLRNIPIREVGRLTGHLWEQVDLLRHSRGAFLVNFNYSGPLLKRDQLITIHDATVRVMPNGFSRAYRWTHNLMVAVLGRRTRSLMTVSAFSRDEVKHHFGLRRDDIVVGVEGGDHVEQAGADADDLAVLRKHGLEPGRYVLGVGSVKPNKNFGLIAKAMELLPGFPWPVAIAGAKDIGIFRGAGGSSAKPSEGFVFLGFVSDEELSVLYRRAACFVFPSSYEGFGLPPVEAMALGCPVLCARTSAMPEVCGDAVLYFDHDDPHSLADALLRFYSDPALRDSLVIAGRQRLLQYNWHRNARILLDHLVDLAPRPLAHLGLGEGVGPVRDLQPVSLNLPGVVPPTATVPTATVRKAAVSSHGALPTGGTTSATPLPAAKTADAVAPAATTETPRWYADQDGNEMLAQARDGVLHVTECMTLGALSFLEQATLELLRAGIPQTILFSRRPDTPTDVERRFDPRVRLLEMPPLDEGLLPFCRTLRDSLRAEIAQRQFVAVHLHGSKAGFLGRLALAGRERPPLFYSPHGLSFLDRRFLLPGLTYAALERLAARVDATLVGCSQGEAALLRGVGAREVKVVENAVPDEFFAITREAATPPVVVTTGRIGHQKAPEVFAELAARFQIAEVPASFVWVGDGDRASEAMLRAAGVQVTGWQTPEQVRQHLARAMVYVQTSVYEGMPLSVLEALAAGLPCVVTDVVGNRDAVQQGITGYVARHPEAIATNVRRLLLDSALHARMSRAARADALERFTGRHLRLELLGLYGLTLDPPARTGQTYDAERRPSVDILLPVGDLALRDPRPPMSAATNPSRTQDGRRDPSVEAGASDARRANVKQAAGRKGKTDGRSRGVTSALR